MKLESQGKMGIGCGSVDTYKMGSCVIFVGIEAGLHHLSISCNKRLPKWSEITEARKRLLPEDKSFAMAFPKKGHYVNHHKYCFHLWEMKRGQTETLLDIWESEPEVNTNIGEQK